MTVAANSVHQPISDSNNLAASSAQDTQIFEPEGNPWVFEILDSGQTFSEAEAKTPKE